MLKTIPFDIIGTGKDSLKSTCANIPALTYLADINWPNKIGYALNVSGAPVVDFDSVDTIVLSFHYCQVNLDWVYDLAVKYSDTKIYLFYDGYVEHSNWWPTNVEYIRLVTWGYQVKELLDTYGPVNSNTVRDKKASCLVNSKTMGNAALAGFIANSDEKDSTVISWHDDYFTESTGDFYVDTLIDYSKQNKDQRPHNSYPTCWKHPAYENSVFNFTNEYEYTTSITKDYQIFNNPGPFLTERTWKPLIAGSAIIPVGQYKTYRPLEQLGLRFNYDLDKSFDQIANNVDRTISLIQVAKTILENDIGDLIRSTEASIKHNQDLILSGKLLQICNRINETNFHAFSARF